MEILVLPSPIETRSNGCNFDEIVIKPSELKLEIKSLAGKMPEVMVHEFRYLISTKKFAK